MTEYSTISHCINEMKGNFIGTVILASDLKAGSKNGRDWTRKNFTIEDEGGKVTYVAWNENIQKLEVGKLYSFVDCDWENYQGRIQIQKGKIEKVDPSTIGVPIPKKPEKKPSLSSLGQLSPNAADITSKDTVLLMQIEEEIIKTMGEFIEDTNQIPPPKIGMYTQLIYRRLKELEGIPK